MNATIHSIESLIQGAITPLSPADPDVWSLLNLILTILGILIALILIILYLVNHKGTKATQQDLSYNDKSAKRLWPRLVTAILAIGAIVLFLLSQDLTLTMIFADSWTIWHVLIFLPLVLFAFISAFIVKPKE